MDTGSGEWQLALGLLSGMDVDSGDWQLALALLSEINADTGSGERKKCSPQRRRRPLKMLAAKPPHGRKYARRSRRKPDRCPGGAAEG
jgi:hypothetical protein